MMWFRRLCFRMAFRGCKVDDPAMKAWVADSMANKSIEGELRSERALELEYFARKICNRL